MVSLLRKHIGLEAISLFLVGNLTLVLMFSLEANCLLVACKSPPYKPGKQHQEVKPFNEGPKFPIWVLLACKMVD